MARRQRSGRPAPVREVLEGLLKPADWEVLKQRRRIREVWETVVPAALLPHTRLVDLRRKELWVEVSASPWVQELQFLKPAILRELEKTVGPGVVKDLRFRIGAGF